MPDVWRDVLVKTIREKEGNRNDGSGFGMWVVQKVKNDVSVSVTVRAGRYYKNKVTGEREYPKDGLSDWDFEALKKKSADGTQFVWDEIKPLLDRKNPPVVKPLEEPTEEPAPEEEKIEECPW